MDDLFQNDEEVTQELGITSKDIWKCSFSQSASAYSEWPYLDIMQSLIQHGIPQGLPRYWILYMFINVRGLLWKEILIPPYVIQYTTRSQLWLFVLVTSAFSISLFRTYLLRLFQTRGM